MSASHMAEVALLAQRANTTGSSRVGDPGTAVLNLWLFFNIAPSHFLLPFLCILLFLQRARRNFLVINVAVTWCISGFASSILLYAGKQTGPEPSILLCSSQASLLYAIPPLASTAVLALVLSVWINLCWKPGERTRGLFLVIMLIGPYVVYFTFASIGAMLAAQDTTRVSRSRRFFYCSIQHPLFSSILVVYAAIVLLITMILNCWIGVTIWRNNRLLKEATRLPAQGYPATVIVKEKKGLKPDDVQFAVRLGIFGVYIVIGLTLSLLSLVAPTSAVPDMVLASMGLAVFLVFGTQPKLWLVWRDLLRRAVKDEETQIPTLTPFQLDPLPGQPHWKDPEAGVGIIPPPPVQEKPWAPVAVFPPLSLSQTPTYFSPAPTQVQSMSEKRVSAAHFQVDIEPRPVSSVAIANHPYRIAPQEIPPEPRVVTLTSPINRTRVVELRGKQPLNSPFMRSSMDIPAEGRQVLSTYESQSNLLSEAAAMSYEGQNRFFVADDSYESPATLAAAASYQSQYVASANPFEDREEEWNLPVATSNEFPSGNANANNTDSDSVDRITDSSSGAQSIQQRVVRTDPIIPRY